MVCLFVLFVFVVACCVYCISTYIEHLWLGICFRQFGTNYTCSQRISILMVRLLTSFAVAATFYGVSKGTVVGDFSLMVYESLLGLYN